MRLEEEITSAGISPRDYSVTPLEEVVVDD